MAAAVAARFSLATASASSPESAAARPSPVVTVISVNNMGRNPTPWVVNQFPTGVTVRSAEILDTAVGTGNNLAVDPSVVTVAVFGDIP